MLTREKKITKAGSLTIPKDLRNSLGLEPGVPVAIRVEHSGDLTLIRRPSCRVCDGHSGVVTIDGVSLCASCLTKFNRVGGWENE